MLGRRAHRACTHHGQCTTGGNRSSSNADGFSTLPGYSHARRYLMTFLPGRVRYISTVDGRRSSVTVGTHYTARNVQHRED